MSRVEIEMSGGSGSLHVDGHDLSDAVRGFQLEGAAGGLSRLRLDLVVVDATRIDAKDVTVRMDPSTFALLERAGWTPPPGPRDPMLLVPAPAPVASPDTPTDQGSMK